MISCEKTLVFSHCLSVFSASPQTRHSWPSFIWCQCVQGPCIQSTRHLLPVLCDHIAGSIKDRRHVKNLESRLRAGVVLHLIVVGKSNGASHRGYLIWYCVSTWMCWRHNQSSLGYSFNRLDSFLPAY
jgi:hypothetical protein